MKPINSNANLISKYKEYYKYLNGEPFPKIWPQLLAEKLNADLVCLGLDGACNYTIFDKFCGYVDNINEDDLVIIGWSFIERYRIYDEKINNLLVQILKSTFLNYKEK